jgi:N-acetyltransferase
MKTTEEPVKLTTEALFNPALVLENARIKLRIVQKADIEELETIAYEPSIWSYFTSEIANKQELTDYVNGSLSEYAKKQKVPFVIIDKKANKIIGMSSYGNISLPDRRIEIGWSWLSPLAQGTGANQSYKYLLLEFAFDALQLARVEFKTDVLNAKARKALLKIGATEEGVLRSHTLMPKNRRRDTIYYSILNNEWNTLSKK